MSPPWRERGAAAGNHGAAALRCSAAAVLWIGRYVADDVVDGEARRRKSRWSEAAAWPILRRPRCLLGSSLWCYLRLISAGGRSARSAHQKPAGGVGTVGSGMNKGGGPRVLAHAKMRIYRKPFFMDLAGVACSRRLRR
jgi:hypothetical protein